MKKSIWITACVLLLCTLFACGVMEQGSAAAPLAEDMDQVRTTLTMLPEELNSVQLLARTSSIILSADSDGEAATYEYRPSSGAYRRMIPPIEGNWEIKAVTASPDGCLWAILTSEERAVMMKSSQGSVQIQQELEDFIPETILCDSIGHVFAASGGTVRRYSPEGALQGTLTLQNRSEVAELELASKQDRMFLRVRWTGEKSVYMELMSDMTLGDSFEACVTNWNLSPIGSFLKDYLVMEADSVGLYAYRENSGWETVCLWAEQHLDGTVDKHLISDAQGSGMVRYEKDGQVYCLNLSPA